MKLNFIVYKKEDIKISEIMGIPESYTENQYKTSLKFFELTKDLYQDSWDKINNQFSKYIEKETGHKWVYPKYNCFISAGTAGFAPDGKTNLIARHWKENPYFMRKITAHELILIHYYEIYHNHYSQEKLTSGQLWALAEIAAWSLTSLTEDVKKWWPWNTEYNTNHNYPHLVKIQLKMKNVFLKRKDFDDYVKKGIKIIKKYPNISHMGITSPGNIFERGSKK
ncbi:MAG: hypothetical protein PF542_06080 [Nanoarchaeota archaeon]|jgi:hypothetical protein|nr:hypothetical protein [Nanoarchaeota archaeon]